jgi:hypothetical protein
MQVLASRSVSSRTYHSCVQRSTSWGTPQASDIRANLAARAGTLNWSDVRVRFASLCP